MLKNLQIRNYALIEHLDIDFTSGLSVITGETGAGKSIMVGALALVLGQRADTKVIQQGKSKCVVEATFDVAHLALQSLFDALEIDYDDMCIIRREVLDSGKSRAFVNDTPVNLQQLRSVASRLIDIHSQHESLLLGETSFQVDVLDAIADSKMELFDYQSIFKNYKQTEKALNDLVALAEKWRADRDYAQFQFEQLSEANLSDGEQETLEAELQTMNHSEEVKMALSSALSRIDDENSGVNTQLRDALSALRKIAAFLPQLSEYEQRIESSLIDLKDVSADLEVKLNDTDFDPQRKEFVEERLDQIYRLQQKHRVQSVAELFQIQADFEDKLARIDSFDIEIEQLRKSFSELETNLRLAAEKLSKKRCSAKAEFEKTVSQQLSELGMPNANFVVAISPANEFLISGSDEIEFLFSANKNHQPQAIAQTASGGELSRLMLVIKSLVATHAQLPIVVLDEIDTGVSGEVAHRMGLIMRQMAQSMQVLAITHLPQIAAKGTSHFKVYKHDTADSTITNIKQLTQEERILEIAEMLSGKNPSSAAIENAVELLK